MEELVAVGAPIILRDGSRVRIRQIHRSDTALLIPGFQRLSPESRYRRFLAPMPELNETMVRYLTHVDHHDHEAMIAVDEQDAEGIGLARYVRHAERAEAAEVAVTVVDDWQGRGLGALLLERLNPVRVVDREAATVEVEISIPAIGVAPVLTRLIRIAARHDVSAPLMRSDGTPRPST